MKVREIMTREVVSTTPDRNLVDAARAMWNADCGVLPVIDETAHVGGVITDRDICLALATRSRSPDHTSIAEVESHHVFAVLPDDDALKALEVMGAHRVRRVPVIDQQGHLLGLLSIDDVIVRATGKDGVPDATIVRTLRRVCAPKTVEII